MADSNKSPIFIWNLSDMRYFSPLFFLLLLTSIQLNAQEIEWQKIYGGSKIDRLNSIGQTSDGGYILGGSSMSDSSGDKNENSFYGSFDYWIVKIDSLGSLQWENTIGGSLHDYVCTVSQTVDGGFIVGGYSNSFVSGDKTETNMGGLGAPTTNDYWILHIAGNGIIEWQNTIGGNADDKLHTIKQTMDSGYIFGGYSASTISGDKTENGEGNGDCWLVKTDSLGNIQWQNTIGGTAGDELIDIVQTNNGGFILGCGSVSNISGDKSENCYGNYDYWIIKTDSTGNLLWQKTIGGNAKDYLKTIIATADGGFLCGGESESDISGNKTSGNFGDKDFWIVKIDSTGNILWQHTYGGSGMELLNSVNKTYDGGFILGGFSNSNISGNKTENNLELGDYWIIKTDSLGNILWQNTIGGDGDEILQSIQQTTNGGYFLGGYSSSNISGDKTLDNKGVSDYWIIKLNKGHNLITGKLFIDTNNNGTFDTAELQVKHKKVKAGNPGKFCFTDSNGEYILSVTDSGNLSIIADPINYYTTLPATQNAVFTGFHQIDSLNDFAYQSAGVINDLCITTTPSGQFRSGTHAYYLLTYSNQGTTSINPTVIFYPDTSVTFVAASPVALQITQDSVIWSIGPLAPFQTGSIQITVFVHFNTPINTIINSGAVIEPIIGDINPACNHSFREVFCTGSIDPNDILVDKNILLTTQFPNPPYLDYIIRFQNTGNDTAFTVMILNPIDTFKLDLPTLEYVAASHPVNMSWIPWERNMQFQFDNILLPDSNVNEAGSHGFIRYRIRPKDNLVAGDSITNFAAIYFDYNNPVLTNTARTDIVLPTSISEYSDIQLHLYPNPASDQISIQLRNYPEQSVTIELFDLYGRRVKELYQGKVTSQQWQYNCDLEGLSSGVYFIVVNGSGGVTKKLIKL